MSPWQRRALIAESIGALILLTGCLNPPAQAFVGVYDSDEFGPAETLSLEIGGTAWRIEEGNGGGVVTPVLEGPSMVVLFGIDSCRILATFEATPGSAYRIRIDGSSVDVEDATGSALEMGPGLVESHPSGCATAGG